MRTHQQAGSAAGHPEQRPGRCWESSRQAQNERLHAARHEQNHFGALPAALNSEFPRSVQTGTWTGLCAGRARSTAAAAGVGKAGGLLQHTHSGSCLLLTALVVVVALPPGTGPLDDHEGV